MPYTRIVLPKAAVCAVLMSLVCLVCIGPSALHAQRPASAPSTPASTELVAVDQRLTLRVALHPRSIPEWRRERTQRLPNG
jgi:uncharacterized membrane protein